ncbi:MAG: lipoate--protein ligase family protein [Pirellulales bacterium]
MTLQLRHAERACYLPALTGLCDNTSMQRLDLTLSTPAENLALDEALLDWAEDEGPAREFLRLWESPQPIVVVGRSSRVGQEVDEHECAWRRIPILRRSSGGAAIVAGPGCLMYAVVLSYHLHPLLRDISRAHAHVLGRLADSLRPYVPNVSCAGTSDLVLVDEMRAAPPKKFSGNSLRAKRSHLLYHGTLLYDFDLSLIAACLRSPPRQPDYRGARSHSEFVTNLPIAGRDLAAALASAFPTTEQLAAWPRSRVDTLVAERFSLESWNREFA